MRIPAILTLLSLLLLPATDVRADAMEVVAGAGPSTRIVQLFFERFCARTTPGDCPFVVPEQSAKHRGGIINADNFLFGRTGRPLARYELTLGKREILLARVPIAFSVGSDVPPLHLNKDDLRKIYSREISNWRQLGGPDARIELVGREMREAVFSELKKQEPFFRQVTFDRIFRTDTEVIDFLDSTDGASAIAFGAAPNFPPERRIVVGDFDSGLDVGLVYDLINADHPTVHAARAFAASSAWLDAVRSAGMLPPGAQASPLDQNSIK